MNITYTTSKLVGRRFVGILFIMLGCVSPLALHAAAPAANTPIGNQASATYLDQNGITRQTTSNTVLTFVLQIPGLALTQDNTRIVAPGGSVFFPHTLTNTGNGTDSFDLFVDNISGDFTLGSIAIYADLNQDGLPDDLSSPITNTGNIEPGIDNQFHFVVGGIVPGSATDGNSGTIDINARSDFSETLTVSDPLLNLTVDNTDTANVSENAVITVSKAVDLAQGIPGTTPLTYTLFYSNTGSSEATNLTMTDAIPSGLTYIAGSGRSSLTGSTVLTDASGDAQTGGGSSTVDYTFDGTTDTLTVVISSIPAGTSGTVTFQVGVDSNIAPQIITNVVNYNYDPDGSGPTGVTPTVETNRPPFEVLAVPGATLVGDTVAQASPGETVVFENTLTNNGTTTDTFDVTIVSGTSNFPAGTTFNFFQEDGNTPLIDTNNNGLPDTGPLGGSLDTPLANTYKIILKATLPINIDTSASPAPYSVDKRVTGEVTDVNGNSATDDATDTVSALLPPVVDITNATSVQDPDAGDGDGTDTDGLDVNADPGTTVIIPFTVENEGNIIDSYNLTVDSATVPSGWTVVLRKVANGSIVSNTGSLDPPTTGDGESFTYVAEVSIPVGNAPGAVDLNFRATSPTSGATDLIINTVNVNSVRELSLLTDNSGQVSPGGSIVYTHILTNLGNVPEAVASISEIGLGTADSFASAGWTSTVLLDINNDGTLDSSDPVVTSLPNGTFTQLDAAGGANDSVRLFVRVFAPLGAPDGAQNVTTLTVTPSGTVNGVSAPAALTNSDTTAVVLSDVDLLKEQALDADNDGIADDSYSTLQRSAKPGESILYRITVTNSGSQDATSIKVFDTAPANTTYAESNGNNAVAAITGDGSVNTVDVKPADGTNGAFEFNIGTLEPLESSVINFGVTIDD